MSTSGKNPHIQDLVDPQARRWEEFYRNRWQHDRVVRSTHGVNCTGGCSWNIHVKDGIVTWEMQALDYPDLCNGIPGYEPRGCQRGISFSWYLYSPLRVKYPYIRGALLDLWEEAKAAQGDPVEAWRSLMKDPVRRQRYQKARGKGGFRRTSWDTVLELISASAGPHDQGARPRSHHRLLADPRDVDAQLRGGVAHVAADGRRESLVLRLVLRSPERLARDLGRADRRQRIGRLVQREVPRGHGVEPQHDPHAGRVTSPPRRATNGTKMVVFSPDFNQVAKYADEWISLNAGQDGAWWMAVNHVILKEFHHDSAVRVLPGLHPKQFSDSRVSSIELSEKKNGAMEGRPAVARRTHRSPMPTNRHGEWKFLQWDQNERLARRCRSAASDTAGSDRTGASGT